jgi:hypothetical protein
MNKLIAILFLIITVLPGCEKTPVGGADEVYLKSITYQIGSATPSVYNYEYDAANRLVLLKNVNDYGSFSDTTIFTYTYDTDGKIKSAWVAGSKRFDYTRDNEGRLTVLTQFVPDGSISQEQRYFYYDDRYERKSYLPNSVYESTRKFFYSADRKNIIKDELYDDQGQLTETNTYEPLSQKNPHTLIKRYFGEFSNENVVITNGYPVTVLQTFENYAIKTETNFGGAPYPTQTFVIEH